MDVKLIAQHLRKHAAKAWTATTLFWQPALLVIGTALTYIGLIATTYALTHNLGWGPAATVAGACAAALGLLAPKFRVEDRK